MPWFTAYDIRTDNDLATDNTIAVVLIILAALGTGFAVASLRRPPGTRGRIAVGAIMSGFAALSACVAPVFLAAAADCRQHRADLAAGRFTLLQGDVTAAKLVSSTKVADWQFELGSHWFVAPDHACPQRLGDHVALAYVPADATHLADTILRLQAKQQCKPG